MKLLEILENRNEALKTSEVAKILGISQQQVYKLVAQGRIPYYQIGESIRFCPADLVEWIKKEIRKPSQGRSSSGTF